MKPTFAIILSLAALSCSPEPAARAQPDGVQKFHFNKQVEDEIGYAQAVKTGNTIHISGVVGAGPYAHHLNHIYSALDSVLSFYGADFSHVVKENLYTRNLDSVKAHAGVRRAFYGSDFPAATWVQVDRLFMPEFETEVELIAVLPESGNR